MASIGDITKDEREAYLARLYANPILFMQELFPNRFPTRAPWLHWGMAALYTERVDFLLELEPWELDKVERHFYWLEDPDAEPSDSNPKHPIFIIERNLEGEPVSIRMEKTQNTLLLIPRGFSKTSLVFGCVMYGIAYEEFKFLVYASETGPMAEQRVMDFRRELETNTKFKALFGDFKPDKNDFRKWTNDELHLTCGIYIKARGRGSQVRGMNIDAIRPDRVVFDDIEDIESVRTPESRDKTLTWFKSDFEPIIDTMNPNTRIFGVGTVLGSEALLKVLERDPEYTAIRFGAIDPDGDPLWELKMSLEQFEAKKESFASAGKLANFYLEYMSQVRSEEDAKFPSSFAYVPWDPATSIARALVIDPAISNKAGRDLCSFAVVSVETTGSWKVLEAFGVHGMKPRDQINKYFELSRKYHVTDHGVESIAYQAALVHFMKEEMLRTGHIFEIAEITHGTQRKDERVEGILQPRYSNGFITHAKKFPQLETQLMDWPLGKKDVPDALAMAIALLTNYVGFAALGGSDPAEDEAEDLEIEWAY